MKKDRELELEAELELSLLQINQLQEELEHSYLECGRLKGQEAKYFSLLSRYSAQVLLTESRVNDSRYSESGFYAKGKSLLSQISQLEKQVSDAGSERAHLEKQVVDAGSERARLEKQVADAVAERAQLEKQVTDAVAERAQLEKQVTDAEAERDREAHGHQENKKRAENLQCQMEQLAVDLKESFRSVALGQKMLTKSQVDLDHLRDSYAEKVASEQELVDLVNELQEKLTLASRYYFDLQKEHPEILLPVKNK